MTRLSVHTTAVLAVALITLAAGCGTPASPDRTDAPLANATPPPTDAGVASSSTRTPTGTTPRPTPTESTPGANYDTTTVRIVDGDGTTLATVDAWVANTFPKRYTGLSDTTDLDPGEGMLFIHGSEGNQAYVMRRMDFPLDIVFIAANGTITTIHHAPVPPEGRSGSDLRRYEGRAKYVLEVPRGYTNRTGVSVGDRVIFENRPS